MTNELQLITYNNSQVRPVDVSGEPWFVGKDIAEILGYTNPSKALLDHVDDEDKLNNEKLLSLGQRGGWLINESGLYSLILSSKLPTAKEFKRWVTSEVLPTIRKTGSYSAKSDKPSKSLEIKERNSRVRLSNQFLKLSKVETLSAEYKNILVSKAAEALTGVELLPLPKSQQKMYSAGEIGQMFGVSAQKIGRISNEYGLKTNEYGEWYRSKSEYSNKEVDTFVYNDRAVEKFREIFV